MAAIAPRCVKGHFILDILRTCPQTVPYIYIYIYIYRERERERDNWWSNFMLMTPRIRLTNSDFEWRLIDRIFLQIHRMSCYKSLWLSSVVLSCIFWWFYNILLPRPLLSTYILKYSIYDTSETSFPWLFGVIQTMIGVTQFNEMRMRHLWTKKARMTLHICNRYGVS